MTARQAPGRTGVRIAGDDYQWRHVWHGCLRLLHDDAVRAVNPVTAIGVEVDSVGNVDDVVLYRQSPPHRYTQVKYAVDWSTPLGLTYLSRAKAGSASVLGRLAKARRTLVGLGEPFEMSLLTNRAPDPADILVSGRDSRTGLLLPKAGLDGRGSERGRARTAWALAAGVDEDEFLGLLAVLEFTYAQDSKETNDAISVAMTAVGLRSDEQAVQAGADWVAAQVRAGNRRLTVNNVQAGVDSLALRAGRVWTTVSVATLKRDPLADQAGARLDWVSRFEGQDAYSKRRPLSPATWDELGEDIAKLPSAVAGVDGVLITGSLRQATGFAVGAAFRKVTGFDVAWRQGPQLWESQIAYAGPTKPARTDGEHLCLGDGLAIVVQAAVPALADVREWLAASQVPIRTLVGLSPPAGAYDQAIPDASAALALAVGIRDAARELAAGHDRVHLFLAGPLGLALLLGQRWNRVKPTTVYEDMGSDGYDAAFDISA